MDWNLFVFFFTALATFASIFLLQTMSNNGSNNGEDPWALVAIFCMLASILGILSEPEGLPGAVFGAVPFVAYEIYVRTPAGKRRSAAIASEEEKLRKRLVASVAIERSRLRVNALKEARKLSESIAWISLRTQAEKALVAMATGESHRPLHDARRALEGGLFFDRADLSIEERLRIERKAAPIRARNASRLADWEASQQRKEERKRYSRSYRSPTPQPVHAPVGPRSDKSTWDREIELWSLYRAAGRSELELALKSVHSKCRRCGRPVSVQNKVDAMALVARTFELPEDLYWRQAIVNTMWEHKRWKIEPSELLHSKISPLSAAARHHEWVNAVDTSDLNSPYPYWAYSQTGAEGLLANFWREGERYSEENWKAASKLAAVAPLIDDCLDCVAKAQQPQRSRARLSPRDRETVLMRDGFRCRNCGRSPREDGIKLHVDHIEPWSKGGTNDLENLQALCEECNLGKSDQEIV